MSRKTWITNPICFIIKFPYWWPFDKLSLTRTKITWIRKPSREKKALWFRLSCLTEDLSVFSLSSFPLSFGFANEHNYMLTMHCTFLWRTIINKTQFLRHSCWCGPLFMALELLSFSYAHINKLSDICAKGIIFCTRSIDDSVTLRKCLNNFPLLCSLHCWSNIKSARLPCYRSIDQSVSGCCCCCCRSFSAIFAVRQFCDKVCLASVKLGTYRCHKVLLWFYWI